jgi:hypothetical protein
VAHVFGGGTSRIATDGDVGSGVSQTQRDSAADSPRTAGYECFFPGKAKVRNCLVFFVRLGGPGACAPCRHFINSQRNQGDTIGGFT